MSSWGLPELSLDKHINDLTDADLSAIFERLPPYDRLIVSEVCYRWLGLSRKAWVDVKHLYLNRISYKHMKHNASIIRQCPNLQSVSARGQTFTGNAFAYLSMSSQLSTVKLYDCTFYVKYDRLTDTFARIFGANIQQASWNELIIHNAVIEDSTCAASSDYASSLIFSTEFLPASLTRLQVSSLGFAKRSVCTDSLFLLALDRLQNLECLCLQPWPDSLCCDTELVEMAFYNRPQLFEKISALKNLKELCIGFNSLSGNYQIEIGRLVAKLPKLEVLFLTDIDFGMVASDLNDLILNPVLRILVLSEWYGSFWESVPSDLPARKRFPNGFGSDPLPMILHIFVCKDAFEKLRFWKSASDAAIIHPIDDTAHRFLEREDIAPIFEGVWTAEKIKEAARNDYTLWDNHVDYMFCGRRFNLK